MNYILGLDIGIGSVGWAVIRNDGIKRIEDFGVRLFESGEGQKGKESESQKRRGYRSTRRLVRRRAYRKNRLKRHLENIGLINCEKISEYFENGGNDVLKLRVKGLSEKLSPQEIAACLINICNKRGYSDFYEADIDTLTGEERKEYEKEHTAIAETAKIMNDGGYRTAAEMFLKAPEFKNDSGKYRSFRNKSGKETTYLISRKLIEKETRMILGKQQKYYSCLTNTNVETIIKIIFSQRCFEDGPGDTNDKFRRYTGFLDSIGNCMYYKNEKRGHRFTALGDMYAATNVLSQYTYIDKETGEINLPQAAAKELFDTALHNAIIKNADVKRILKKYNIETSVKLTGKKESLPNCFKYLKVVKPVLEECGFDWNKLISEDQLNFMEPSFLNRIGDVLSTYITPRKRRQILKEAIANEFSEKLPEYLTLEEKRSKLFTAQSVINELAEKLAPKKFSGTSKVSDKYMKEAVEAFLNGETYGNFQARKLAEKDNAAIGNKETHKILPPFKKNEEFRNNPVVFRSINETRKIINAVVGKYDSPSAVNIEVASELGRSYEERTEIQRKQARNEKENNRVKNEISKLLHIDESDVNGTMITKYKLGELQNWHCLYSGKPIDKIICLQKNNKDYEIDHIVPFSLILDDTNENKALVYLSENQLKRQRTPLMYLTGGKAENFKAMVNTLYKEKRISRRKYEYLMLKNLDETVLDEWKSRNMNDTRYIAKYLVNYLSNNLRINNTNGKKQPVYAVKGGITSRMRKLWLNHKTWGANEKSKLRQETNLHHAADAVVIANCRPAYVEIAGDAVKLGRMFKRAKNNETEEYKDYLEKCKRKMKKYYGFNENYTESLLRTKGDKIPSLIEDLRNEVDIRFNDSDEELFKKQVKDFYKDDAFSSRLKMPLVSYKQERKSRGQITKDNPVSLKEIDGKIFQIKRKDVMALKKADLKDIYSNDGDLIDSLTGLLKDASDNASLADVLKAKNIYGFKTLKGRNINKVSVKKPAPKSSLVKQISEKNKTVLDSDSYYCTEVYKDKEEKTRVRGIKYADLAKKDKKLYLKSPCPPDYTKHVMYLFKNDYVKVFTNSKKGGRTLKFSGYYKSIFNINQQAFCYAENNKPCNGRKSFTIKQNDTVEKYAVDILGKMGGKVHCGKPFSLMTGKN